MKLFILHFQAIEHYPPLQNLLHIVGRNNKVTCFTTTGQLQKGNFSVNLFRLGKSREGKVQLLLSYLLFNSVTLFLLILKRPSKVIYYEIVSAFPTYVYKRFINRNADIYIHYHEYTSTSDHLKGGKFNRFLHQLEKWIYPKAKWISQTNPKRLEKFLSDEHIIYNSKLHKVLPNFPLKRWATLNTNWKINTPLRIIYVGYTADLKSSYVKEFLDWIKIQSIETEVDFYCVNGNQFPKELIGNHGLSNVRLMPAISYQELPELISNYHVGLILYRGLTENYIYNAPNKLFEYLSCGLDVWYPKVMIGIHPYQSHMNPKVIGLDFENINQLTINSLIKGSGLKKRKLEYYAEEVYGPLLNQLLNENTTSWNK